MSSFLDKVKGGGGFTTEGEITDYNFVEGYPFGDGNSGEGQVYLVLDIKADDAEEAVQKAFWYGSGEYLLVEDDGKVIRAKNDDGEADEERAPKIYVDGEVYKLLVKLDELGFPVDSRFPDPDETFSIDFRGLIGTRVRFTEEKVFNETGEPVMGKKKTKGKHKGRAFQATEPVLQKVLSLPEAEGKKTNGKAKKVNGKGVAASSKKASKATEAEEDESDGVDTDEADSFLTDLLKKEKGNSVPREKLTLAVTRLLSAKKLDLNEHTDFRKFVTSEEYLTDAAERGVIEFDASAKKQTVALA